MVTIFLDFRLRLLDFLTVFEMICVRLTLLVRRRGRDFRTGIEGMNVLLSIEFAYILVHLTKCYLYKGVIRLYTTIKRAIFSHQRET